MLRLLILFVLSFGAGLATAGGRVVFAQGDVWITSTGSHEQVLAPGAMVNAGDLLRTGANGYIHVRFDDGGFLGVRPASRFVLEAYATDAAAKGGIQVRYRLDSGTVRAITGKSIEADRSRFRFNTPVAAIGVRGTDYTVNTDDQSTRVTVRSGAIVLAPLGEGCMASALGACGTDAARLLGAGTAERYLEYRRGDSAPEIRQGLPAAPSQMVAPVPPEPLAVREQPPVFPAAKADPVINVVTSDKVVAEVVTPINQGAIDAVAGKPAVNWGRWTSVATGDRTVVSLLAEGYQPRISNSTFGVVSTQLPLALPSSGKVGFRFDDGIAYLRTANDYQAATIRDPQLTVDFAARRFDTSFEVKTQIAVIPVSVSGSIQWQGYMIGDSTPDTQLNGILGGANATSAGYTFEKTLTAGQSTVGAIIWKR